MTGGNPGREAVSETSEIATLGGGCFWCTEAVFLELRGVQKVVSGYAGGTVANPTYEDVCTGSTGHAEVVQVVFDPRVLPYRDLLRIFFTVHDPTTRNRQGNDVGSQYRSVIFVHSAEQNRTAEEAIREIDAARIWNRPLVTEVAAFTNFYPAEEYHQNYFARNPSQAYCRFVVAPKVAKFRKAHADLLRARPATAA